MNNELKNNILILKNLVFKGNSVGALQRIDDIEKLLSNSVIIPKDKLQFEYTDFEETSKRLGRLDYIVCQISGPKEVFTYDSRNKFIQENKEEFMKHVKEDLKKKIIDHWNMSENE